MSELKADFLTIVVNPDAGAVLDSDAIVVHDLADRKVADNDIGRVGDRDTCTGDLGALANTNDRL